MTDTTTSAATPAAADAQRPTNPLLVPPREETVELYRDDIAKQLDQLVDRIDELTAEIEDLEARAADGGGPPKRMGRQSPAAAKRAERRKVAQQHDELAQYPSVRLLFREPNADDYDELQLAHPPRTDDRLDQLRGWNGDTFPTALVRLCLIEPQVTDEQFDEFRATVTKYNWRNKVLPAVQRLTDAEPDLPFAFAVSAVQRIDKRASKRQPDTASPSPSSTE